MFHLIGADCKKSQLQIEARAMSISLLPSSGPIELDQLGD